MTDLHFDSDKAAVALKATYGDMFDQSRFDDVRDRHIELFGRAPEEYFSSPGRIEIVGNHTDHNGGKVLCAAINFDTLAAVSYRDDGIIEVYSKGYPKLRVDSASPKFIEREAGDSIGLIKGVLDYFIKMGKKVGGFNATMNSSVPSGSGVSSSSSFELAIAEILNVRYNDGQLEPIFKAKAAQYAENVFFKKPCGLMDQSAIALGGVNLIDFKNSEYPAVKSAVWKFDDLDIFVIATGGDHSDLTDEYAAIPREMKKVAALFKASCLAEVPYEVFNKNRRKVRSQSTAREFLRAEHFYEENKRVEDAVNAVEMGDEKKFLDIVNASGRSSRRKLQNTYSERAGDRSLENALDAAAKIRGVEAVRVHGGGFAGTILVFAKKEAALKGKLEEVFGFGNVFKLNIRQSGATRLDLN